MITTLQVGQQTITASDLLWQLTAYPLFSQLVQEIIIDRAIAPIDPTTDRKLALKHFYTQNRLTSQTQIDAWLKQQKLTQEQLERRVIRQLKIDQFKQQTWGKKLETYFLQRKSQLDQVMYSLLRVKETAVAQELYWRIQEGEQTFTELAKAYSLGPEAQTGGLIGPTALTTPHPIIAQLLAKSRPGQLLPLTRVEGWLVIVRLEKLIPAKLDESMRQRLLNELFTNWLQEQSKSQSVQLLTEELVSDFIANTHH